MFNLNRRSVSEEEMDDLGNWDESLRGALDQLPTLNRMLGAYRAFDRMLLPFLADLEGPVRVLDVGCGIGDIPLRIAARAGRKGLSVHVTGLDANANTVEYARHRRPAGCRDRVAFIQGDAADPSTWDGPYDVVIATQFLHHLRDEEAIQFLRDAHRQARYGVLISDLHRHPLALAGIHAIVGFPGWSSMIKADAPVSVRRGFTRNELHALCTTAGPRVDWRISWSWAFRWSVSSLHGAMT